MNISYKSVSKEETYCCSKNDIRNFFPPHSEIRFYFDRPKSWNYKYGSNGGVSLCHCSIHKNCYPDYEFVERYWREPSINFFSVSKEVCTEKVKRQFAEEALPKILEWCEANNNFLPKATPGYQRMDIILIAGKLIYKESFKRY